MKKSHYKKELEYHGPVNVGSDNEFVRKVQEWINLQSNVNLKWYIEVSEDDIYGNETKNAVETFQKQYGLTVNGIVNDTTWHKLTEPMKKAYELSNMDGQCDVRDYIVEYARQHLENRPAELYNRNEGPWVRAYMDGSDGNKYYWCVGFAQTPIDMALSQFGKKLDFYMPLTWSCDVLGNYAIKKNSLIRNKDLRKGDIVKVQKGDLFLSNKTEFDWTHTGIIISVDGEYFDTIEGNSNNDGSRNGNKVVFRRRNWSHSNIDVFSLGNI